MLRLEAFGERIPSRDPDRQTAEIHTRIALMNRFSALGRAKIMRVARASGARGTLGLSSSYATTPPCGRDAPDGRIDVDLGPCGLPQLAGSDEDMRRQGQREARHRLAPIGLDRAEKGANLHRVDDRRKVRRAGGGDGADQKGCRVALGPSRVDGVAEHAAGEGSGASGRLKLTLALLLPEHG